MLLLCRNALVPAAIVTKLRYRLPSGLLDFCKTHFGLANLLVKGFKGRPVLQISNTRLQISNTRIVSVYAGLTVLHICNRGRIPLGGLDLPEGVGERQNILGWPLGYRVQGRGVESFGLVGQDDTRTLESPQSSPQNGVVNVKT